MSTHDRKAREFERRGQDILATALALFESDEWEQVTVDQIAQAAEVGKGTIYKHFASKDDIYAHLAIDFQRGILQKFAAVDATLPVVERFRQHLRAGWEMHLSSKELHRVFLYCSRTEFRARLLPDTLSKLKQIEAQVTAPTLQMVTQGIEEGVFPCKPLGTLLFGAQAAFWGAIQLVWSGYLGDIDKARHLEELSTFLLAGLIYHDADLIGLCEHRAPTGAVALAL